MASIEYGGAAGRGKAGSDLFSGITFWLARQVPFRDRYKNEIAKHGGTVTIHENEAGMRIHDHLRPSAPVGTYSYTFIDQSIKDGVLADKEQHHAGQAPDVVRQPGDVTQPTRKGKVPYTKEEDCLLYDWLTKHLRSGGTDGGNAIYQEIANQYPRHTFQSWRDRWRKQLKGRPRPSTRSGHATSEVPTMALPSNESTVPTSSTFRVPPRAPARAQEPTGSPNSAPGPSSNLMTVPTSALRTVAAQEQGPENNKSSAPRSKSIPDTSDAQSQVVHRTIEPIGHEPMADVAPRDFPDAVLEEDQRSASAASQADEPEEIVVVPEDEVKLWWAAADLEDINIDDVEVAWDCWAKEQGNQHHSGETWRWIWESHVRPRWIQGFERYQHNARSNPTAPDPHRDIVPRAPAEPITNHIDVADSPSRRAKANSSRRLVPNSQSTGSQPTTQESEPLVQRKRRRPEPAYESSLLTLPRKKRSVDRGDSTLASRQDDGQILHEEEELFVSEDDALLDQEAVSRASPSLTDPSPSASGHQRMNSTHLTSTVECAIQVEDELEGAEPDSDLAPDSSRVHSQGSRPATQASEQAIGTPSAQIESSDSLTTTPGNTARQHVISPTPKQRHQQPSSSDFSTTTPGNTATQSQSQSQSQSDDSQDAKVGNWFASKKAEGVFPLDQITEAFEAASYDLDLADMALRGMRRRRGILPNDQRGIWTKGDDKRLRSNDVEAWRRLRAKHGLEACVKRQDWLKNWKDGID